MIYRFDGFEVDDAEFRLSREGLPIPLEPKALRLLLELIVHSGSLIRKQELLDGVWPGAAVSENALTRGIALLRRTLEDDSRKPRYIETVPTVGYRFLAEVETIAAVSRPERAASPAEAPFPAEAAEPRPVTVAKAGQLRGRSANWYWRAVALIGRVALINGAGGWLLRERAAAVGIHSVAVLPLDNVSGNPEQECFAQGTTDEMITELARIQGLRITSGSSVMQNKGAGKTLRQIASELHVDAIVQGSVMRSGDRLRINAQLIDTRSEKHIWAQSFEDNAGNSLGWKTR